MNNEQLEKMKVSNFYKLPMKAEGNLAYSADSRYSICTDSSDTHCEEQAKIIALALNNHDKLLEMVKNFDAFSRGAKGYIESPLEAEALELINSIESI